jgi:hypothetical protein
MRRYTNVLSLLHILRHQRLTLLPPTTWFDQNDALGLLEYARRLAGEGDGTVYALCFAEGVERAHHWQIFAGDTHGVCIQFNRERFIEHVTGIGHGLLYGPVVYRNLSQIREMKPIALEQLPFLKRDTFKDEAEYRLVAWDEGLLAGEAFDIPMPIDIIDRVILGPAMPQELAYTLKDIACSFADCADIRFTKSKLVNNESWAQAISEGLRR